MLMLFQLPTSTELAHPQKWFCWWPQYWYVRENFCSGRSYHVILFGLDIASLLIWEEKYSLEMVLSRTIQQIVGGRGHSQSGWTAGESEDRRRACWRLWTPSSWCSTPGSGTFSGCYKQCSSTRPQDCPWRSWWSRDYPLIIDALDKWRLCKADNDHKYWQLKRFSWWVCCRNILRICRSSLTCYCRAICQLGDTWDRSQWWCHWDTVQTGDRDSHCWWQWHCYDQHHSCWGTSGTSLDLDPWSHLEEEDRSCLCLSSQWSWECPWSCWWRPPPRPLSGCCPCPWWWGSTRSSWGPPRPSRPSCRRWWWNSLEPPDSQVCLKILLISWHCFWWSFCPVGRTHFWLRLI